MRLSCKSVFHWGNSKWKQGESAVQRASSGGNQPKHAALDSINIHWAHIACTERGVWHTLDVLASLRLCRGSGSLPWHPSSMPMWLLCPHSELYDTDLVRESNCTGHLCMSRSHLSRLPKVTADSLTIAFTELKSKNPGKHLPFLMRNNFYCHLKHSYLPQS